MLKKPVSFRMRHLISCVLITASACICISFLVLVLFNRQISDIKEKDYLTKMKLAANDLDVQQEIMESISYMVKITPCYREFYAARNAYYDLDIIEDMTKFQNYSPVVSSYYCLLSYSNSVYSPKGKLDISEFIYYTLGIRDGSMGKEDLLSSDSFWIRRHPTQKDVLLAVAPFYISSYLGGESPGSPDACMIFFIPASYLQQRLAQISGLPADGLRLCWNDQQIWGGQAPAAGPSLHVVSEGGGFRLFSSLPVREMYPQNKTLSLLYLLVLMGATILFAIFALLAGKRSYSPFDRIIKKLDISPNGNIHDIEKEIEKIQESQHYNLEQFQKNLQEIARQRCELVKRILFAKLNIAGRNEGIDELMAEAGISLNRPLFCVLVLRYSGSALTEGRMSLLAQSACDGEIGVYSAGQYEPGCFILILNYSAYGQEKEIVPVLQESLEGAQAEITLGDVYDDVSMLHLSLVSAFAKQQSPAALPAEAPLENWYDDRDVWLVMEAVKQGDGAKAHQYLEAVIHKLKDSYPSILFQRCICMDITNCLLKTLHQIALRIDQKYLYKLSIANDLDEFSQELDVVIGRICEAADLRKQQMEYRVIDYIKEVFTTDKFTIFEIAEHFGLSEREVGAIVKKITGMPYKEFIIHLRIERAKALLAENSFNVAQTGEAVGYSNIPYFIKLFRKNTGYTPGEYKKKAVSQGSF